MTRLAVVIVAATLVTACTTTQPKPAGVEPVSGAPIAVPGLDWFLTEDPTETRLAYGRANSGDFRMALICEPGSGRVSLMQAAESVAEVMVVESGGELERLSARAEPAGVQEGEILLAEATSAEPVLRRFRTLGWLASWQGEQREILAAHRGSRPSINRFFTLCG